jgi:hypothetical protein
MTRLVVLLLADDDNALKMLDRVGEELKPLKEKLAGRYLPINLTVLRGDFDFGTKWLRAHPERKVIVILEQTLYNDGKKLRTMLGLCAWSRLFSFVGTTVDSIVMRTEECVQSVITVY